MGDRNLRRLLILGASSAARGAAATGVAEGWLGRMLTRKPRMMLEVALANKITRIVWALMAHGGSYRAPATTA